MSSSAQALARRAPVVMASLISSVALAMWGADHASSFGASDRPPDGLILRCRTASHPPRIADAFFRRTRSAAVSANARSLRASSRSRSLIRFFSSLVA